MARTIIPHNQSLKATPYSAYHPPTVVPGTANGVALPKPEATAVLCIAPAEATTYNPNWEQELTLHPGDPHLALAPDDTYPNQVFHRDYIVKGVAWDNPLAATLRRFWRERGYSEEDLRRAWSDYLQRFKKPPKWVVQVRPLVAEGEVFFVARKEQAVVVHGVVDLRFMTSEGPTLLEHGAVLVQHPDDPSNQWLVRAEQFARRYEWQQSPRSGLVIPTVD